MAVRRRRWSACRANLPASTNCVRRWPASAQWRLTEEHFRSLMTCCGVDLAFKASTPRDGSFPDLTATPTAHLVGSGARCKEEITIAKGATCRAAYNKKKKKKKKKTKPTNTKQQKQHTFEIEAFFTYSGSVMQI